MTQITCERQPLKPCGQGSKSLALCSEEQGWGNIFCPHTKNHKEGHNIQNTNRKINKRNSPEASAPEEQEGWGRGLVQENLSNTCWLGSPASSCLPSPQIMASVQSGPSSSSADVLLSIHLHSSIRQRIVGSTQNEGHFTPDLRFCPPQDGERWGITGIWTQRK